MGAGASARNRYGPSQRWQSAAKATIIAKRLLNGKVPLQQRREEDAVITLSINRCPPGFRLRPQHIDWTEKFNGSAGALQNAVESRTIKLPADEPGVYIRSTRLSNQASQDVFFFIRQQPAVRSSPPSTSRIHSPSRPTFHSPSEKESGMLFGQPLCQVMRDGELPDVVQRLQAFLQRDDCINKEGIFRVPAGTHILKEAQVDIDRGQLPKFLQCGAEDKVTENDAHVAAGVYKLFYRRMPQPLIPWDSYDAILSTKEPRELVEVFKAQVRRWPPVHRKCMENLLDFLATVARHAKCNKMSKNNLATVFAPSVLRQRNASPMDDLNSIKERVKRVQFLLRNHKSIFLDHSAVDAKRRVEL